MRIVAVVFALLLTVSPRAALTVSQAGQAAPGSATAAPPARIISLIPAVTEMLFAMGAGPQVIAVSSFDKYPADTAKLPRIGALIDPDIERILFLRPNLVMIYGSQTSLREQLDRAHIPVYVYSHAALPDIAGRVIRCRLKQPRAAWGRRRIGSLHQAIEIVVIVIGHA